MLKVRVPASTSNLGPGLDCLGLALKLYRTFEVSPGGPPAPEGDLVVQGLCEAFRRAGRKAPEVSVRWEGEVPVARGLGSSAAARVAGLMAGNGLLGEPFSKEELLDMAAELEGHPDNAAPALLGGLVVAVRTEGGVVWVRMDPPDGLFVALAVPEFSLDTERARKLLPGLVALKDAVYNISRAALLVAALAEGRCELLREATKDRLHQPYREPLVPGFGEVCRAALDAGACGVALSGAGPSVVALCFDDGWKVARAMADAWERSGVRAEPMALEPDRKGARYV
ncbi:MAG TPA: homoserine kinase [Candidatus Latescibacteria bacterium]|nr:homoserine kinase [Candidatus Latescibacterota bacterium]